MIENGEQHVFSDRDVGTDDILELARPKLSPMDRP